MSPYCRPLGPLHGPHELPFVARWRGGAAGSSRLAAKRPLSLNRKGMLPADIERQLEASEYLALDNVLLARRAAEAERQLERERASREGATSIMGAMFLGWSSAREQSEEDTAVELRARENYAPARMRHRPERCDRRVLSACRPTRASDELKRSARQPSRVSWPCRAAQQSSSLKSQRHPRNRRPWRCHR